MNETNIIIATEQELSSEEFPYTLSLRRKEIDNEKELHKFIASCERMMRNSPEYKMWTGYVRDVLGHRACSITGEKLGELSIDIHHHPYSLYIIIKGLILKCVEEENDFCSFDIITKCIEFHYENKIPYVPIVKSLHEKFHNGFLAIPISLCHGDIDYFMKYYSFLLEDEEQETILKRLKITTDNCGWEIGYKWVNSDG